jgi:hypothetical protein
MAAALVYGTQAAAQPATASRLIATATSEHNNALFVLRDSSYMTYTNDRGGDLEHEMKFDRRTNMVFNPGTGSYRPDNRTTQTYDAQSRVLSSLVESYNLPSSSWANVTNQLYTYNSQGNLESHTQQFWNTGAMDWNNTNKMLYFYNGDNTLDTTVHQNWSVSAGSWANNTMSVNNYDVNGDLLIKTEFFWDGVGSWINSSRTIYSYTAGNVDAEMTQFWDGFANAWINSTRTLYTYDGNKNVTSTTNTFWNSSSSTWINMSKITNTYTSRNDLETTLNQNWDFSANNWLNLDMMVYTHDTNHNNTVEIVQTWNTATNLFRNLHRFERSYNSRGQMTMEKRLRWNIGGFWENLAGDTHSRYYYQTHTLDVNVVAQAANAVRVFPVPASNMLNIRMEWNQPEAFKVSIVDAAGRLVRQWSETATAEYSKSIPVSDLAAGNYFLNIQGQTEKSVTQFMIAR